MLTKAEILAKPLPSKTVPVPEWGGQVVVRRLTAREFTAALADAKKTQDHADMVWIAHHTFDEAGARMFTADDAPAMAQAIPFDMAERITAAILEVNPSRETVEKNLPTPPSA
jgi:hypothetical protein